MISRNDDIFDCVYTDLQKDIGRCFCVAKKRVLGDGMTIVSIPFSEYMTCVEVFYHGHSLGTFCSEKDYIDEWFIEENSESIFRLLGSFLRTSEKGSA